MLHVVIIIPDYCKSIEILLQSGRYSTPLIITVIIIVHVAIDGCNILMWLFLHVYKES